MDTNGWLLVLVDTNLTTIGTYGGPWMLMDGYAVCRWLWIGIGVYRGLWRPMDSNGGLLVLVDTNG